MAFFTRLRAAATLAAVLVALTGAGIAYDATARAPTPGSAVVRISELPPEALHTIALIRKGGPFPYERDGVVFGNVERELPRHERGYYHEYTVRTPGVAGRGARRIIAGRNGELYYTADHYRSFRRIIE